jgi:hypothetical protein
VCRYETRGHSGRAAVVVAGELEGAHFGGHALRGHHLCLGISAVRSADWQGRRGIYRAADGAGVGADEALLGSGRFVGTSVEKFAAVNAVYARYFPKDPPARIFVNVPAWPGPFDIEIDCIATR